MTKSEGIVHGNFSRVLTQFESVMAAVRLLPPCTMMSYWMSYFVTKSPGVVCPSLIEQQRGPSLLVMVTSLHVLTAAGST